MKNNKYVVCDCRIYQESIKTLENLGYNVILMPEIQCLDNPISAHPDMSVVKMGDFCIVASDIHNLFTNSAKIVTCNREIPENAIFPLKYPSDVGMNCAIVGKRVICNKKYTSKQIIKYAEELGYEIIDVKQGYAKCSIAVVDDNSLITEDVGIYNLCKQSGLDVLLLNNKSCKLNGYDYGFIGGCSGKLSGNKLVFNGDICAHSEYDNIFNFCNSRNVRLISLCNKPLYDVGSIIEL